MATTNNNYRYEVYFSKTGSGKGKLIGKARTQIAAINFGAEYPVAGFFNVWDTKNERWLDF